jgi:hypothetical protein
VSGTEAPVERMSGALQRKPEWSFQAWLHRFLNRAVLQPCEIRGIDKAGAARNVNSWSMAVGRGVKDGTPDHEVVQGNPLVVVKIECKHGDGGSTAAQEGTATAYERCGVTVIRDCRTMQQALRGLRLAGTRLHANADNLAVEYQARADAALRELELRKGEPRKKGSSKPRAARPTRGQVSAGHRFTAARLGLGK